MVGDLNQHLVVRAFDDLLTEVGLTNHVDFPTHISSSFLDPVITDLSGSLVTCRPLGSVGSSDHVAILTSTDRLTDTIDDQGEAFTYHLLSLQSKYVPCRTYSKSEEQGRRRLRAHNTQANRNAYKTTCCNMINTQKAAIRRWKNDLTREMSGQSAGKQQQQGLVTDCSIPLITTPSGEVVKRGRDKVELLSAHFSNKMSVPDPTRTPSRIPILTTTELDNLHITTEEKMALLCKSDTKKALGPDDINHHLLKRKIARDAAWKLSCARRAGKILDGRGIASLYRAQVRPVMEYTSSCPSFYIARLERIQPRAQRMV
ncbi:hypothetical protein E2C01_058806 [Portunus trituberculatus]|uniref:Endonuclease/exonuclease/phosphatase domain-containing protein n=1 Tax=Portunus trituberculatus TaxID=210409 RepID=A0A5B7H5R2_PORTR|nr:hypothetical protein [Portunus trituberculatus]